MTVGADDQASNLITDQIRSVPRSVWVVVLGSILFTTAITSMWTQPWSVLRGNPEIQAAYSVAASAKSLPTPTLGILDCSTAALQNLWICWGDVTYQDANGSQHHGQLLLTDEVRKACLNADPATQATQYPKGCDFLHAVYDRRDTALIALVDGNPTAQQRWLGFAQLLVFPTLVVGIASGMSLAAILYLIGRRRSSHATSTDAES
jgi:hypothetical protein